MILALVLVSLLQEAPASAPASPPAKAGFAPDEAKRISTDFAAWLQALDQSHEKGAKGEVGERKAKEAKDRLGKTFADLQKKKGIDPLSLTGDLSRIVEAAVPYRSMSELSRGQETLRTFDTVSKKAKYAIRLPKAYDPAKKAWPAVVAFPAAGKDPKAYLAADWKDEGLRESTILVAPEMPAKAEDWPKREGPATAAVNAAMLSLGDLVMNFRIDQERIVVAGNAEGGAFAVTLASYYPDRFAGAVSRGGGPGAAVVENLGNVATYFAGAAPEAKKVEERAKALGRENVTLADADDLGAIVKWIGERTRRSAPEEILFYPAHRFARNAYWVKVSDFDEKDFAVTAEADRPMLRGKVDRTANSFDFTARGVTNFTLLLTDAIVDLDKPLKVVVNGREWSGTYKRELDKFLTLFRQRNDPGTLYTAYHVCEVPKAPAGDKGNGAAGGTKKSAVGPAGTGERPRG